MKRAVISGILSVMLLVSNISVETLAASYDAVNVQEECIETNTEKNDEVSDISDSESIPEETNDNSTEIVDTEYENPETENVSVEDSNIDYVLVNTTIEKVVDDYKIKVTGNLPENSEVKVIKLNSLDSFEQSIKKETDSDEFEAFAGFDISIWVGDKEWQPVDYNENVKISITNIDSDKDIVEVYRIDTDNITKLNGSQDIDGDINFNTEHFTPFVIGGVELDDETTTYLCTGEEFNRLLEETGISYAKVIFKHYNRIRSDGYDYYERVYSKYPSVSIAGAPANIARESSYTNSDVYIYTPADKIYFNADSSHMFEDIYLTGIQTNNMVDFSLVRDASYMFANNFFSDIDLSWLDTSSMVNLSYMFLNCIHLISLGKDANGVEVGVKDWNVSNVENFSHMFSGCTKYVMDTSYWDVSSGLDFSNMYEACEAVTTLDFSEWNTSSAINMSNMFKDCTSLSAITVSDLDTQNVKDFRGIFSDCSSLEALNLSSWIIADDSSVDLFFKGDIKLKTIISPKIINTTDIKLPGYYWVDNIEKYNYFPISNLSKVYERMNYTILTTGKDFHDKIYYTLAKSSKINDIIWVDSDIITHSVQLQEEGVEVYADFDSDTKTVRLYTDADTIYLNPDSSQMFYWLSIPTGTISFFNDSRVSTSLCTNMKEMFSRTKLLELKVDNWDVSSVENFESMFASEYGYEGSGWGAQFEYLDLSSWDVHAKNIKTMFRYSKIKEINVSGWDVSEVTEFNYMFSQCKNLTSLDISTWDVRNASKFIGFVSACTNLKTLDISNCVFGEYQYNFSNPKYVGYNNSINHGCSWQEFCAGCNNLETLRMTNTVTSYVTSMVQAFYGCDTLDINQLSNNLDVSGCLLLDQIFRDCDGVITLDLNSWNVENCGGFRGMFLDCSNLERVSIKDWDMQKDVSDIYFSGISYDSIVSPGTGLHLGEMFKNCVKLKVVELPIISPQRSKNKGSFSIWSLFENCSSLETIVNIQMLDTSLVDSFSKVFYGCTKLQSLDIDNYNTSNVTSMSYLFYDCKSLQSLPVATWDVSSVNDFDYMCYGCESLQSVDLSSWVLKETPSNTARGFDSMFARCKSLTSVDLSNWNTINYKKFSYMFDYCSNLRNLKLTDWVLSSDINIDCFILYCDKLEKIYAPKTIGLDVNVRFPSGGCFLDDNEDNTSDDSIIYTSMKSNIINEPHIYIRTYGVGGASYGYTVLSDGMTFNLKLGRLISDAYTVSIGLSESGSALSINEDDLFKINGTILRGYDNIIWLQDADDIKNDTNAVQVQESGDIIYARYNTTSKVIELYTEASKIYMNTSCDGMFCRLLQLDNIDFLNDPRITFENTKSCRYMFLSSKNIDYSAINFNNWNLNKCENFDYMFTNTGSTISLDLSDWTTPSAKSFRGMFASSDFKEIYIDNITTSFVTDFCNMFSYAKNTNLLPLDNFDTSSSKTFAGMFEGTTISDFSLIYNWDVSSCEDFSEMFNACKNVVNLDLSNWDMSSARLLGRMFGSMENLENVNIKDWNVTNVKNIEDMFSWCSKLQYLDISGWELKSNSRDGYADLGNSSDFIVGDYKLKVFKAPLYVGKVSPYRTISLNLSSSSSSKTKWYLDDNLDGVKDSNSSYTDVLSVSDISHTYIRGDSYTVNYYLNNSTTIFRSQVYDISDTVKAVAPVYNEKGKILDGWYLDMNKSEKYDFDTVLTHNLSLYGYISDAEFLIKFDGNGGTVLGETEKIVKYGQQYGNLPSAEYGDNYFNGWYTGSADMNNAVFTPKGEDFKVSHTSNVSDTGEKLSDYQNSYSTTDVVTIDGADGLIVDLYYSGESTSYDWVSVWVGSHPSYTASKNVKSEGYVTTSNGASNSNNKFGGNQSGSYTVNDNELSKIGHCTLRIPGDTVTFAFVSDSSGVGNNGYGYYAIVKEASVSAPTLLGTQIKSRNIVILEDDTTLYAKWSIDEPLYTVTFDTKGGSAVAEQSSLHYGDKITQPNNPTKDNYSFLGWYFDETYTVPWNFETDTVEGDTILYAKWGTNLVVTFETNGGTEIPQIYVIKGEKIEEPITEKVDNHILGWYSNESLTKLWNFDVSTVLKNTILYAKWEKDFEVTYHIYENTELKSTELYKPNSKINNNYLDISTVWYKDEACTEPWDFANDKITSDLDLYGKDLANLSIDFKNLATDTSISTVKVAYYPIHNINGVLSASFNDADAYQLFINEFEHKITDYVGRGFFVKDDFLTANDLSADDIKSSYDNVEKDSVTYYSVDMLSDNLKFKDNSTIYVNYVEAVSYLTTGSEFNRILNKATSGASVNNLSFTSTAFESDYRVDESGIPTYLRYTNGNVELYTEATKVYLNADSSHMFEKASDDKSNIQNIKIFKTGNKIDSSLLTNVAYMFYHNVNFKNGSTTLELLDTTNVTNFEKLFAGSSFNQYSNWDTVAISQLNYSSAENISGMFEGTRVEPSSDYGDGFIRRFLTSVIYTAPNLTNTSGLFKDSKIDGNGINTYRSWTLDLEVESGNAFWGNANINKSDMFSGTTGITEVKFNSNMTSVPDGFLANTIKLATLDNVLNLTSIGTNAFYAGDRTLPLQINIKNFNSIKSSLTAPCWNTYDWEGSNRTISQFEVIVPNKVLVTQTKDSENVIDDTKIQFGLTLVKYINDENLNIGVIDTIESKGFNTNTVRKYNLDSNDIISQDYTEDSIYYNQEATEQKPLYYKTVTLEDKNSADFVVNGQEFVIPTITYHLDKENSEQGVTDIYNGKIPIILWGITKPEYLSE